ncbi:hypothetical protein ACIQNU_09215 [Streptomyces sp. NPDC091292]|uniref:Rv1733c family protein n=1 Tax=Streptomyces sp. NPDC091292 TaxID=3365991 RepID=UPI00380DA49B
MRAIVGLWRWRHNPLCRATDLAEAWLALGALLLIVVAAPVVGVVAGSAANRALTRSVEHQRTERHETVATVVRKLSRAPMDPDPETVTARDSHSRVVARWTAPDGTDHRGTVMASLKSPRAGDRFPLWTDAHGRLVAKPLDTATAATHAALAGIGAGIASVALVECARRLVVWRLVRRRYTRWDQAWDKAGPDWGRTGAGS